MSGSRSYALFGLILGALVIALIVVFGTVQLASDALESRAAVARTLPTRIPVRFGIAVYRLLDRIAPAPYVETSLSEEALARGDADAAERYALRLPASPIRDELLARVASMLGNAALAREYFLAAPDPEAVGKFVEALAVRDPAAAYALERLLQVRLARNATHPDAVAEAYWQMGRLANRQAWREVSGSTLQRAWLRRALGDFETAVSLAPLSERYVVEAANQADLLGDRRRAAQLFAHAVDIDPASADAIAGLGVVAWENGEPNAARRYLARARALDPRSLMVRALERDLR
ncbi:MAG TPA: tetratricopeptide repeat protein [Candidatus Cybelea sp.]